MCFGFAKPEKSKLQEFLEAREWEDHFEDGKPLFTFRSEVWYNGFNDPSVPLPEFAARVNANDIVQVAKVGVYVHVCVRVCVLCVRVCVLFVRVCVYVCM